MRDDFDDLRGFLRDEGITHGIGLQQAEDDPRLADAGERALAQVLARHRARRHRRRLVGGLAVAAVGVVVAVGAGGAVLRPVSPAAPGLAAPPIPQVVAVAPLQFTAQPAPAGPVLDELAQASAPASGYLGAAPARTSWYAWDASSPQHGRLVVVTPRGGQSQMQSFPVRAPEAGRIDVSDPGQVDSTTTVRGAPTAEATVADVLDTAATARCADEPAGCAGEGPSPLGSSPGHRSAALRALAGLPDAQAAGRTTDRLGRPAIGFTAGLAGDQTIVVLADPDTGDFLGAEWIDNHAEPRVTRVILALPDLPVKGE